MTAQLAGFGGHYQTTDCRDGVVDRNDAAALAELVDQLSKAPELAHFIGGVGIYAPTAAHPPFVHVDTRPWKARW